MDSRESDMTPLLHNVSILLGRDLTTEEITCLSNFQRINQIDDSDPLITVLALMARSHLILETLPTQLQQTARETIDLHQRTLREQSTLIAKELVLTVAQDIQAAHTDWKTRWIRYGFAYAAGAVTAAVFIETIHLLVR
jgi:hypothetical protein